MKDVVGTRVEVGDTVVFCVPQYSELGKGKVIKINPTGVTIETENTNKCGTIKLPRHSGQFARIGDKT